MMLFIAGWLLFSLAPVQTFLARKAASYLSNELNTNVFVEKLRIRIPHTLEAINFGIDDQKGQPMLRAQSFRLGLQNLSFNKHLIHLGRIAVTNPEINLVQYKDEKSFNFSFLSDYFSPQDTTTASAGPWQFKIDNLTIINGSFALNNLNCDTLPYGIDNNHLCLQQLDLQATQLLFTSDTLSVQINQLSTIEKSGFTLALLKTDFLLCPTSVALNNTILKTASSDLVLDLEMHFNNYRAFSRLFDSVYFQASILPSEFNLNDLSWFIPELRGLDNLIRLEGKIAGELKNIQAKNLRFSFGHSTRFAGNILLNGLPNFSETFIHLDIKELVTQSRDLEKFRLPSDNSAKYLSIPETFRQLGLVRAKAVFSGFYTDFVSYGSFYSSFGKVNTDLAIRYDFDSDKIQYQGSMSTRALNLGMLLSDKENFGLMNMSATLTGSAQLPSKIALQFSAVIDSLEFKRNIYDHIAIKGELKDKKFDGQMSVRDDLVQFGFQGLFDMNQVPPVFDFSALLADAKLGAMNLVDRDTSSKLSSRLTFNFSGSTLDELQGTISIDDTHYSESGKEYLMKKLVVESVRDSSQYRKVTIRSDYADADFKGIFEYTKLWPAVEKMLYYYLPSLATRPGAAQTIIADQKFDATIRLKNTDLFSDLFFPGIYIEQGADIETNFDTWQECMNFNLTAPSANIKGIKIKNLGFNLHAKDRDLAMESSISQLFIKEPGKNDSLEISLEKLDLSGKFSGDTIYCNFLWEDAQKPNINSGAVSGFLSFTNPNGQEFKITQSNLSFGGSHWSFDSKNSVMFRRDSVTINNLLLSGSNQTIGIDGMISPNPNDKLNIAFKAFNIANFDPILLYYGINAQGTLNGSIGLKNIHENPGFNAEMRLDGFTLNKEMLGDLILHATWNPESESIWIDSRLAYTGNVGTIIPLSLTGSYYPSKGNNQLDLLLKLNNFKLQPFQPYIEGVLSNLKGLASGELAVKGPLDGPVVEGSINLMRTEFRIDFTNITYSFADILHFEKNRIYGKNIKVFDNYGNFGICDAQVFHNYFKDISLDIKINASNMAGLETGAYQSNIFYGKAFASGTVWLSGPLEDITLKLNLQSEPKTSIAIPISYAVDMADNSFIIFKNPTDAQNPKNLIPETQSAFRMNMDLDVTRDASIQLFLPYQMGNITSTGDGNLKMHYNTSGDFTMYGDYFMHQGEFLFTLRNLINRPFNLQKGGVIRWSGSPYNAEIDLNAIYKLKVNLNSLPNINEEYRNRRFPVDCVLKLQNSLMNPDITFSLRMPNVDQGVQRQVFSAIDTNNQVMLSRQVISLLLLGNFNFSMEQGNIASTLGTSSFDLISNQLSNWLSQISKDVSVGVNYRPGDELSPEELELALSTQLFEDRVLIDGNFLVGSRTNRNASNVVGDVNVEFLLTRDGRFRIKAFNKYNDLDITRRETPYTQGVGAFYRREFNGVGDLLRRRPKTPLKGELENENDRLDVQSVPIENILY